MPKPVLVSANNKKLQEVNKRINGLIKFNNKEYEIKFIIIDNLLYDAIIRTDELARNNVIIDYERGMIQIGD